MKRYKNVVLTFTSILWVALIQAQSLPDNIDISTSPNGVVDLPNTVHQQYIDDGFVKYTKIECPNGEAIHFVAQENLTDAQIVRSRSILEFYLKNVPESEFGSDKTDVINTMGTNDATLLLLNGSDNGANEPNVPGQLLYEEEIAVEGHQWYINNEFENHRDASFEEILHLMHDMGIGVDGPNSIPNPALPLYQQEIRSAQLNANSNSFAIWPIGADGSVPDVQAWYNELNQENSLSQEYLASVIDAYYGLWDPWIEDPNTSMWGIYIAHNRNEVQTEDLMGFSVVEMFFSPQIDVDMIIDPSFYGVFSMMHDNQNPYTFKSQYLQHCYLSGNNNSGLKGNALYNRLKGNNGNNTFEGLQGNDCINGMLGANTAIFTGNYNEYNINNLSTHAIVSDEIANRDGVDTLYSIQYMQFADQIVPIQLMKVGENKLKQKNNANGFVYPNPVQDILHYNFGFLPNRLLILNIHGQVVMNANNNNSKMLSLKNLNKGVYFLKAIGNSRIDTLKFIKQ